jgi:hypothetical protein
MLVVYHPDAGTSNADKLALLASADLPTTTNSNRQLQPTRADTATNNDASR